MNSIEDFLEQQQARKKWSVRQTLQRVIVRMRRMLKRRLRGESRRQWIERNLKDSEAGIVFDLVQCTVSLLMVYSVMAQNWHAPSYAQTDSQLHKAIDLINLGAITIAFGLRSVLDALSMSDLFALTLRAMPMQVLCCQQPQSVLSALVVDH